MIGLVFIEGFLLVVNERGEYVFDDVLCFCFDFDCY